jgi:hypothetical protein
MGSITFWINSIATMGRRTIEIQLGGPDLIDRVAENISPVDEYVDSSIGDGGFAFTHFSTVMGARSR